jgi:hypothetical protein
MSDYKTALSKAKIQSFIDEKRKFNINIGEVIGKAWADATKDIGNTLVTGLIIGSLGFLAPWLLAGLYIGKYEERTQNKPFEIGTLFRGFDHGMPIFICHLIHMAVTFAVLIIPMILIFVLAMLAEQAAIFGLLILVVYIAMFAAIIVVQLLFFFAVPFVVFAGMEPMEAIKSSSKIIKNNLLTVFILTFAAGMVAQLGLFACIVGIYFTLPIAYYAYYYGINDVFQLEADNADDDIIEHLVG